MSSTTGQAPGPVVAASGGDISASWVMQSARTGDV